MGLGYNDIIILLGAGSSVKAKIPTSNEMLNDIEDCIKMNRKKRL